MALTITKIELPNMKNDGFSVDTAKIDEYKELIAKDLKNLITDVDGIKTAYTKMAKDKDTKGTWQTVANTCVEKAKKYHTNLSSTKNKLSSNLTDSLLAYILAFIQSATQVQAAADNINTNSE